jgi:hypothetical protein
MISDNIMSEQEQSIIELPKAMEKQLTPSSSWFSNFGLSPNLTNQLSTLSSSILQVTSKVGSAANTFVQNSLQQRPPTPNENEQPIVTDEQQTSTTVGTNKDFTST